MLVKALHSVCDSFCVCYKNICQNSDYHRERDLWLTAEASIIQRVLLLKWSFCWISLFYVKGLEEITLVDALTCQDDTEYHWDWIFPSPSIALVLHIPFFQRVELLKLTVPDPAEDCGSSSLPLEYLGVVDVVLWSPGSHDTMAPYADNVRHFGRESTQPALWKGSSLKSVCWWESCPERDTKHHHAQGQTPNATYYISQ